MKKPDIPVEPADDQSPTMPSAVSDQSSQNSKMSANDQNDPSFIKKYEALQLLAGAVAHDFNNIFTALSAYCDLMNLNHPKETRFENMSKELSIIMTKAHSLIQKLQIYSHPDNCLTIKLDLAKWLRVIAPTVRQKLGDGIKLQLQIPDQPWLVRADPSLLQEALDNILANAQEAQAGSGEVTISLFHITQQSGISNSQTPTICLEIADKGPGVKPEIMDRIFDPFFTTKGKGFGKGLGLSVAQGIIKQMGGIIRVLNASGGRFQILLPQLG